LLGLSHGAADGAAGWMLGTLANSSATSEITGLFLTYNVLGFACQPIAGWMVDRGRWAKPAVLFGLLAQVLALIVMPFSPWLAVSIAGLGSALFHVGAGSIALQSTPGLASGVGLFAAPGVLGLGLGGALATIGFNASAALIGLLSVVVGWLAWILPNQSSNTHEHEWANISDKSKHVGIEIHDVLMLGLLAAISLRSLAWTALNAIVENHSGSLLALAISACVGKALGGMLADRLGWRNWVFLSLSAAAAINGLGPLNDVTACLTAALLQSAAPATVAALLQWMPRRPALASGLTFGLAIAIGGAPFSLGLGHWLVGPGVLIIAVVVAAALSCGLITKEKFFVKA
jgi:FSR family fosmidomycin resistance protein-like MFS transporter